MGTNASYYFHNRVGLRKRVSMDKVNLWVNIIVFAMLCVFSSAKSQAQDAQTLKYGCTDVALDYNDDATLTKQEKLALMSSALIRSIDAYSSCVAAIQKENAAGGGKSGGTTGSSETKEGSAALTTSAENTQQNAEDEASQIDSEEKEQSIEQTEQTTPPAPRQVSKPKDNDSIICKLLWEEIQTTTEEKRAGFEKQYQQYNCGKR